MNFSDSYPTALKSSCPKVAHAHPEPLRQRLFSVSHVNGSKIDENLFTARCPAVLDSVRLAIIETLFDDDSWYEGIVIRL